MADQRCIATALVLIYGCAGDNTASTATEASTISDGTNTSTSSTTTGDTTGESTSPSTDSSTSDTTTTSTTSTSGEETFDPSSSTADVDPVGWALPTRGARITGMVHDPGGDLVLSGFQFGSVTKFGETTLPDVNDLFPTFLVRLDPSGEVKWHHTFTTNTHPTERNYAAVAIGPSGDIVLVGVYNDALDVGAGPLPSAGDEDLFVAAFSAGGAPLWSRAISSPGVQYGTAVAISTSGEIFVGGAFEGEVTVGKDVLVSKGGADLLIAKFASGGGPLWGRSFGDFLDDKVFHLTLDSAGDLLMLASIYGDEADLGNGPIPGMECCTWNRVLAKFDATGANIWSTALGGGYSAENKGLAACSDGRIVTHGTTLEVRSSTGAALWQLSSGGLDIEDVDCDIDGQVLAAGHLDHTEITDYGDGPVGPFEADPVFFARFSSDGGLASGQLLSATHAFSETPAHIYSDLIVSGSEGESTRVVSADFGDVQVDFGDGPLPGDVFLVRRYD